MTDHISHARINKRERHTFYIKMLCNWSSSRDLLELWDKMGHGNYSYSNKGRTITMVDDSWTDDAADYIVVINATVHKPTVKNLRKTIFMKMEPVFVDPFWEYVHNNPELLKGRFTHLPGNYNNNEWHISKTLPELMAEIRGYKTIEKVYDKEISAILSHKNLDPGHVERLNFAREAQHLLPWHSYGSNVEGWINYKGPLPPYQKDGGLLPYKYTFNAENMKLPGYYTEKLIDAILCETLCFYSGHEDVQTHVDPNAYVLLDLSDINESIHVIKNAVDSDLWTQRLPYIKAAKKKILEETGFFPRLFTLVENESYEFRDVSK